MPARLSTFGLVLWLAALVLPATAPGVTAQSDAGPATLQVLDQSQFWLEGSSTVNRFTCHVDVISGHGPLPTGAGSVHAARETVETAPGLSIPVDRFDCGNDRMSADLKETLGAATHPRIQFRLHDATVQAAPDTAGGWYRLDVLGYLTVSGTERLVRVEAWGREIGDARYRVRGCKALEMTYFGIDPPTKFLGMVKVHNRIDVHFDLVAQAAHRPAPSSNLIADSDAPSCSTSLAP